MVSVRDDPMVLESQLPYPKTLDRSVLLARAQKTQEAVPKIHGVLDDNIVEAASSNCVGGAGKVVGTEPCKLDNGAQIEAHQEFRVAKPNEDVRVAIEQQREGCDESSTPTAWNAPVKGKAKRKERGKNWIDHTETDELLKAVTRKKNAGSTRMDKAAAANESFWDAIAKAVLGRTGNECRMRMDTLKKSYSKIKKYCEENEKEFNQLNEEILRGMKVSPRLTEVWFNQIHDFCPPRPKKRQRIDEAGSPSKSRTESSNGGVTTTLDEIEPSTAIFEPVRKQHNAESASWRGVAHHPIQHIEESGRNCALSLLQLSKDGDKAALL